MLVLYMYENKTNNKRFIISKREREIMIIMMMKLEGHRDVRERKRIEELKRQEVPSKKANDDREY